MTNLGELTKLLQQGYITGEYVHSSEDGDYRFVIKTITPLDEVAAQKDANHWYQASGANEDTARNVFSAIEILARSIRTVNDVDLDKVPGAEGANNLEKRRYLVSKFSEKLLLDLWAKYQELRTGTDLTGSDEENEAIKK